MDQVHQVAEPRTGPLRRGDIPCVGHWRLALKALDAVATGNAQRQFSIETPPPPSYVYSYETAVFEVRTPSSRTMAGSPARVK